MDASVSVVIPTRNRAHLLGRVITPLLKDSATFEVVVVVDDGEDGSWELVSSWAEREPRLRVTRTSGIGCPSARQVGFMLSRSDIVLLLDDDVIAQPGLVTGHRRCHAVGEANVVVGYMPVLTDSETRESFATVMYAEGYEQHCQWWEADPQQLLPRLWNGNVSIERNLLERAGGPGSSLPLYGEDRDLGLRLLRAGGNPVFVRSLAAVHLHKRTALKFAREGYDQGRGLRMLHHLHGDILGDLDPVAYLGMSRAEGAQLLRWARRPRLGEILCRVLEMVVRVGGTLRIRRLEAEAAGLWRTLERQRGLLGRE